MKRLLKWISILSVFAALGLWLGPGLFSAFGLSSNDAGRIQKAFQNRTSNIVVETKAQVTNLHPDLIDVEKHQVFTIELENGHRLKVMHNLSEAPGVPVGPGSEIRLRGEYDWTPEGGIIHWTHNDPNGVREGGWIKYQDILYQ